jgi:DNA-binding NtrC family response regulator
VTNEGIVDVSTESAIGSDRWGYSPGRPAPAANGHDPADRPQVSFAVGTSLADMERVMIAATLRSCGGNKTRAAAMLGVSLKTLYNRLNEYRAAGIDGFGSSVLRRPRP